MAKDDTTAKAFLIAVGVSAIALVVGGQYAACDSMICDWLGSAAGWIKTMFGKAQNTIESATGNEPTAMDIAVNLIAGFEGFRSHAYKDVVGVWTIGYGHKIVPGDGFDETSSISEVQARDLLAQDAAGAQDCVESNCSGVALSAKQKAALISLAYNIGNSAFSQSTLVKLLNQGEIQSVPSEFNRWVYAKGIELPDLVKRREQEAQVFIDGTTESA